MPSLREVAEANTRLISGAERRRRMRRTWPETMRAAVQLAVLAGLGFGMVGLAGVAAEHVVHWAQTLAK